MSGSKSPRDFVAARLADVPRSGIRDFFEIVSSRQGVVSLGIGEPDFVTPWHIREASIFALEHGATAYTANLGLRQLRREIAAYVEASFGVTYDPDTEILVTVGVSEALDLAVRAVVEPGDSVLYHEPAYVSYAPLVTFAHGVPVPVVTSGDSGFRLTRAQLEDAAPQNAKALLLNFPTNPTGAVLTPDDAREVAAFACDRDLLVISDEIYSELTYDVPRVSVAALPGMRERTVFLHGFSKAWAMTGFRLGFACAPPHLLDAMMKIHQYTMLCAPILSQKAGIEALQRSRTDVERMRGEYERRRNLITDGLRSAGLACHRPGGAFYAFPRIAGFGLSSRDFALRLLDEENVACVPGTAFGPSGEGYLRCSYATGIDTLKEALERIARFVKRLKPVPEEDHP